MNDTTDTVSFGRTMCEARGICPNDLRRRNLIVVHTYSINRIVQNRRNRVAPSSTDWYTKHMYFESRSQAGQLLANQLFETYRYENCAVVAMSDGAVLVGEQLAAALHAPLMLLLVEDIEVPGESLSFGGVSQRGNFTINSTFSTGEVQEYTSEFHGYLNEQKREKFQKINRLLGDGGVISEDMLRDRVVILVADGIDNGAAFDVAMDFLKPIRTVKIIAVTPVASIPAVDKLHMQADELHILDVKENYMGTNHYYEDNTIPGHEETIAKINQMILNWK